MSKKDMSETLVAKAKELNFHRLNLAIDLVEGRIPGITAQSKLGTGVFDICTATYGSGLGAELGIPTARLAEVIADTKATAKQVEALSRYARGFEASFFGFDWKKDGDEDGPQHVNNHTISSVDAKKNVSAWLKSQKK